MFNFFLVNGVKITPIAVLKFVSINGVKITLIVVLKFFSVLSGVKKSCLIFQVVLRIINIQFDTCSKIYAICSTYEILFISINDKFVILTKYVIIIIFFVN